MKKFTATEAVAAQWHTLKYICILYRWNRTIEKTQNFDAVVVEQCLVKKRVDCCCYFLGFALQ